MKFGVLVFPGSQLRSRHYVIAESAQQPVTFLWHDSEDLQGVDAVRSSGRLCIWRLPAHGGDCAVFAGDAGGAKFAAEVLVLGICNGFQILAESGLLPGALMRNAGLKYICKQVHLRVETANSPFTNQLTKSEVLEIPIGHMEGNYFSLRKIWRGWKPRIGLPFESRRELPKMQIRMVL